jgi:hypothetical protein
MQKLIFAVGGGQAKAVNYSFLLQDFLLEFNTFAALPKVK